MATILLAIKPDFVEKIFSGIKKYEFRTVRPSKNIDKIFIYETAPKMRVVGYVSVTDIICDSPEEVWNITSEYSGISREFFDSYFKNKSVAYAYCLDQVVKYKTPKKLSEFGVHNAPQSFVYV